MCAHHEIISQTFLITRIKATDEDMVFVWQLVAVGFPVQLQLSELLLLSALIGVTQESPSTIFGVLFSFSFEVLLLIPLYLSFN